MAHTKGILKTTIFLILFVFILLLLQVLFTPVKGVPDYLANVTYKIKKIPTERQQVVFLGASHVYSGIDPHFIYKQNGIVSYNLSTDGQRMVSSYYVLKNFFSKNKAELVVIDVSMLFVPLSKRDGAYQYYHILDSLPVGRDKIRYAWEFSSYGLYPHDMSFYSVFFPFYHYHSRWNKLSDFDWTKNQKASYFMRGYDGVSWKSVSIYDNDFINLQDSQQQDRNRKHTESFEKGIFIEETAYDEIYSTELAEDSLESFERIRQLCKRNNAEILLIKVPVMTGPAEYTSSWTMRKSLLIHEFAREKALPFVDLQYDIDLSISPKTDFQDAGKHLNHLGAIKVSSFLGDYLSKNYSFPACHSAEIESQSPYYEKIATLMDLSFAESLEYYTSCLEKLTDCAVFMTFYDDGLQCMSDSEKSCLKNLGIQTNFDNANFSDAFVAVIDKGEVQYESLSNNEINYEYALKNGIKVSLKSSGFLSYRSSKIKLKGKDYSLLQSGLHIAVYDYATDMIIDRVGFDFRKTDNKCFRANIGGIVSSFMKYEYALMRQMAEEK